MFFFFRSDFVSNLRGPPLNSRGGGGGRSIFEINNFGGTLREINNLLQELFHINMQQNVKFSVRRRARLK